MELNEFKDRLFDVLNESDALVLADLPLNDRENTLTLKMEDGSRFALRCELLEPLS